MDLWAKVDAASRESDNYLAQGFIDHPDYAPYFWTSGARPAQLSVSLPQRKTERMCAAQGYGHPESPFKLIGAKQVGKGGLAGMRLLMDLKKRLGRSLCVWPFEKHADEAQVVIVEIYPRLFLRQAGVGNGKVRDRDTLNMALNFFKSRGVAEGIIINDHLSDAIIASAGLRWLAGKGAEIPEAIIRPRAMTPQAAVTEGWIFGV